MEQQVGGALGTTRPTYFRTAAILLLFVLCTVGCRSVYYSTWEKFGKYKCDLLQSKVKQVRDDQKETTEQLKDALTRLQELYGFKGGELEKMYRRLQGDYDNSAAKAAALKKRIAEMDQIATDLFTEWEKEDASISTRRCGNKVSNSSATRRTVIGSFTPRRRAQSGASNRCLRSSVIMCSSLSTT